MEDLHKKTSAKNYKVTSCNFKIICKCLILSVLHYVKLLVNSKYIFYIIYLNYNTVK